MLFRTLLLVALATLATLSNDAVAQRRGDRPDRGGHDVAIQATDDPGIAWFGVWEDATREAKRTGKPILLFSAAPQCRAVPGMW